MSALETTDFLTPRVIERAYGLAMQARDLRKYGIAEAGLRAARARDERLLLVLEKGAEFTGKASEEQNGRTRRDSGTEFYMRVEHTEAQLWRNAYVTVLEGHPSEVYQWIYGAAAIVCGYI